jgi:tetratricopeptide (TPR) repeat protein
MDTEKESQNNNEAKVCCDRGENFRIKNELDLAIHEFTKAISIDPKYADAYYRRGSLYYQKGDYDHSIADCTEAIRLNPKDDLLYRGRAYAYKEKGNYDCAIADFTEAIRLFPNDAELSDLSELYYDRSSIYSRKCDYDNVIADCTEAIRFNPNKAGIYNFRGIAFYFKGEYDRSILDYSEAIKLNSNYAEAYLDRGTSYNAKGEYDNAITDFSKALQCNPKISLISNIYNERGMSYHYKNEYSHAIADYNEAIKIDPNYAEAYNNRGLVYILIGDFDHGLADCNKALQLNPDYANAYNNRGLAYYLKGKLELSIADCSEAIRIHPNYPEAYYNRGSAYKCLWNIEKSKEDFAKVQELGYGTKYDLLLPMDGNYLINYYDKIIKTTNSDEQIGGLLFFDWQKMSSNGHGYYGRYFYEELFNFYNIIYISNNFYICDGDLLNNCNIDIIKKSPNTFENLEVLQKVKENISHIYIVLIFGNIYDNLGNLNNHFHETIDGFIGMISLEPIDLSSYKQYVNNLLIPIALQINRNEITIIDFEYFIEEDFEKLRSNGYIIKKYSDENSGNIIGRKNFIDSSLKEKEDNKNKANITIENEKIIFTIYNSPFYGYKILWLKNEILNINRLVPLEHGLSTQGITIGLNEEIYVAGYRSENNNIKACYWKNGELNDLAIPQEATYSYAEAIAIGLNGDVYVTGKYDCKDDIRKVCYWKNGEFNELTIPSEATHSGTAAITIGLNGEIYVAGFYTNKRQCPCYWKNGELNDLTVPLENISSDAKAITIGINGEVYVAGHYYYDDIRQVTRACYWKNGYLYELFVPSETISSHAYSINIGLNGEVYVAGCYFKLLAKDKACYWKNSELNILILPPTAIESRANAIVQIINDVVYVGGYYVSTSEKNKNLPIYWENNNKYILLDETKFLDSTLKNLLEAKTETFSIENRNQNKYEFDIEFNLGEMSVIIDGIKIYLIDLKQSKHSILNINEFLKNIDAIRDKLKENIDSVNDTMKDNNLINLIFNKDNRIIYLSIDEMITIKIIMDKVINEKETEFLSESKSILEKINIIIKNNLQINNFENEITNDKITINNFISIDNITNINIELISIEITLIGIVTSELMKIFLKNESEIKKNSCILNYLEIIFKKCYVNTVENNSNREKRAINFTIDEILIIKIIINENIYNENIIDEELIKYIYYYESILLKINKVMNENRKYFINTVKKDDTKIISLETKDTILKNDDWICGRCKNINGWNRNVCTKCGKKLVI